MRPPMAQGFLWLVWQGVPAFLDDEHFPLLGLGDWGFVALHVWDQVFLQARPVRQSAIGEASP